MSTYRELLEQKSALDQQIAIARKAEAKQAPKDRGKLERQRENAEMDRRKGSGRVFGATRTSF